MTNYNWIKTGESADGKLDVWINAEKIEGEKYLKIQYKNKDGKNVGNQQEYSFEKINLLKGLIDIWHMEYGWDTP